MCVCVLCMYVYMFIMQISNTNVSNSLAVTVPKLITANQLAWFPYLWISRYVQDTSVAGVRISRSVELLALQLAI